MEHTLLIVDDDEDDFNLIKDSLLQIGMSFPIHFEKGGIEALRYLQDNNKHLPSLIILDVNMPQMNGLEALEMIRRTYNTPVILYTTALSDEIIETAKKFGALDCVKKGTSYSDNIKFAKRISEIVLR